MGMQRRVPTHKYNVIGRWVENSRLELRCSRGQYHVARGLSALPDANATLQGDKPHLGFGILICPKSGAIFRVIFESISNSARPPVPKSLPGAASQRQDGGFGVQAPSH